MLAPLSMRLACALVSIFICCMAMFRLPFLLSGRVALTLVVGLGSAGGGWAQTAMSVVELQPLSAVAIAPWREASASVLARNESRLSAEVAGTLLRWTVDAGATVKRGEVLAQLDPVDYQLALTRAQAAHDAARARQELSQSQLKRAQELVAQGFFSNEALTQRETEAQLATSDLASSRAALTSAQRQLQKTTLRAPFAASVKQRLAQVGESVAAGTPLYVLVEAGASEVSAALAVDDVASLRRAAQPVFETQGQRCPVRLLRLAGTITAPARTQEARLALSATCSVAGAEGRLLWQDSGSHVPAAMLVRRAQALGVFVRQEGKARFVPLPGAQEGQSAAVGLPLDTVLVVRGQNALQDGQQLP